jgi:hypothetical protein
MDKTPFDFACQVPGCNRKIKTTVGAMRGKATLKCSAGHVNEVDGSQFDKDVRQAEKRIDQMFK